MPYPYTPTTDLGWRGVVYPAGTPAQIPDDLAILLGLTATPSPQPEATPQTSGFPAALTLINEGDAAAIKALPTIGAGAARIIVANRPEAGYASLEQVWELCPKIMASPYTTDPEQVAAWGVE